MVRMASVWDRSSAVLSGRGAMLAAIAAPTLFLPGVIRAGYIWATTPIGGGPAPVSAAIGGLLGIVVALVSLWGQLALIAASSAPETQGPDARRIATARFLPALGVIVVLVVALTLLALPPLFVMARAGFDFAAAAAGTQQLAVAPGAAAFAGLYILVLGIVLLFVGARLALTYAVIVNERLALGAIGRSWRLTRRHTWRIVGVLLLWVVVLLVATWATQAVVGTLLGLLLGREGVATVLFVTAIATAAVSTVFSVIAIVFTTQLYVALAAQRRAADG